MLVKIAEIKLITFIILVNIFLSSCSPTLKLIQLDPNSGKLPTKTKLGTTEIVIDKPINLNSFSHFLFIKKNSLNGISTYEKYIYGTLKNIGGFDTIYNQEEMEQYVIQHNLADKVNSISDNIGLYKLEKEVGSFLICETSVEHILGYDYRFHFKIINPENAEVVLEINHFATNWSGLDKPLFNPVFNYYIDWLKKNRK